MSMFFFYSRAGKECILKQEDPDEYKRRGLKSNEHSESEHNEV